MMSPAWLLDILSALMLVVAAVSATRLVTAWFPANRLSVADPTGSRSSPRGSGGADTDIAHLLMGIAMAGMLAPSVKTLPPHAWEAIFGLLTAWFGWRLVGDIPHPKLTSLRLLSVALIASIGLSICYRTDQYPRPLAGRPPSSLEASPAARVTSRTIRARFISKSVAVAPIPMAATTWLSQSQTGAAIQ
jgi:Domain of unknown function (DUF5134)